MEKHLLFLRKVKLNLDFLGDFIQKLGRVLIEEIRRVARVLFTEGKRRPITDLSAVGTAVPLNEELSIVFHRRFNLFLLMSSIILI